MPILVIAWGLLLACIGARIIWRRLAGLRIGRRSNAGRHHPHDIDHSHGHDADLELHAALAYTQDHGDCRAIRSFRRPTASHSAACWRTASLAVSCRALEALGIMVIAIGLNRILLGLSLIRFLQPRSRGRADHHRRPARAVALSGRANRRRHATVEPAIETVRLDAVSA